MSLLQTARNERAMRLLESRRPLVMRTDSTEDDSSLEAASSDGDTNLSGAAASTTLPKSIDWSLTYSSDEESQKQSKRSRSLSEPGLEGLNTSTTMRRRSRTLTFDLRTPFSAPAASAVDHHPRPRCTPVIFLAALFMVCCYTTFWLPYPEVPPVALKGGGFANFHAPPPVLRSVAPHSSGGSATPMMKSGRDAWMHARSERIQEPLIYRKDDDPLAKFYQQEAFTTRSYTKEANIAMLVVVSLWAVWEHRRRKVQLV